MAMQLWSVCLCLQYRPFCSSGQLGHNVSPPTDLPPGTSQVCRPTAHADRRPFMWRPNEFQSEPLVSLAQPPPHSPNTLPFLSPVCSLTLQLVPCSPSRHLSPISISHLYPCPNDVARPVPTPPHPRLSPATPRPHPTSAGVPHES